MSNPASSNPDQASCPQCGQLNESSSTTCTGCGSSMATSHSPMNTMDVSAFNVDTTSSNNASPEPGESHPMHHGQDRPQSDAEKTNSQGATFRDDHQATPAAMESGKTLSSQTGQTVDSRTWDSSAPTDSNKTMLSDHHGSHSGSHASDQGAGSAAGSVGRSKWGKVWKDIADSNASPMMTIRTEEVGFVEQKGNIIQKRSLAMQPGSSQQHADYEVIQKVGEGSMGQVFTAQQSSVQRVVAIKTLKPKLAAKASDREKFLYEAMITGDLDHPNIVPIHDLGVSDDGTLFYSMKHVTGTEWQAVLTEKSRAENVSILMKVADALAFAHSRRVIHRDLKPENVMLGKYGEVLVMDWGLAVDLKYEQKFTRGGTPAFMAPEMAAHEMELIDHRSDVYLLGAILYQLVVGYAPHPGRTVHECITAATQNIIIPVKLEDELIDIAFKAMATSVYDRYQSVADFQEAIREYQKHKESITFADRGYADLKAAENEEGYESYSRAVFAFQDALDVWPENSGARSGLASAKLAYAKRALEKEDFDLGLSLVNKSNEESRELYGQLEKGSKELKTRKKRLTFVKNIAVLLGVVAIGAILAGGYLVQSERNKLAQEKKDHSTELKKQEDEHAQKLVGINDELKTKREEFDQVNEKLKNAEQIKERELKQKEIAHTKKLEEQKNVHDIEIAAEREQLTATKNQLDEKNDELFFGQLDLMIAQKDLETSQVELKKREKTINTQNDQIKEQNKNLIVERDRANANEMSAQLGQYKSDISLATQLLDNGKIGPAFDLLKSIRENPQFPAEFKGWELHRLYQLCHEDPRAPDMNGPVVAMETLSNGDFVAVSAKGLVQRFDSNRQLLGKLDLNLSYFANTSSIDLSPNGQLLALSISGSFENDLFLIDLSSNTPKLFGQFNAHREGMLAVRFVNNDQIATLGLQSPRGPAEYVRWSLSANELSKRGGKYITGNRIIGGCLSNSGTMAALILDNADRCQVFDFSNPSSIGPKINRRNIAELANQASFPEPLLDLTSIQFLASENQNRLICGSKDGLIVSWNFVDDSHRLLVGHQASITNIKTRSANNLTTVLSSSEDGTVIHWDTRRGRPAQKFLGHQYSVNCCAIATDGSYFVSGDGDLASKQSLEGKVRTWRADESSDQRRWENGQDVWCLSPIDGTQQYLVGDGSGIIKILDADGISTDQFRRSPGHEAGKSMTAVIPTNKRDLLITCSADETCRVWNLNSGQLIRTIQQTGEQAYGLVSSDGKRLYTHDSTNKNKISVWNLENGQLLGKLTTTSFQKYETPVVSFALSPDDKFLLSWHKGKGQLEIWDTSKLDADPIYKPKTVGDTDLSMSLAVDDVLFAPDNRQVWVTFRSGNDEQTAALYELGASPRYTGQKIDLGKRDFVRSLKRGATTLFAFRFFDQNRLELFSVDGFKQLKPQYGYDIAEKPVDCGIIERTNQLIVLDDRGNSNSIDLISNSVASLNWKSPFVNAASDYQLPTWRSRIPKSMLCDLNGNCILVGDGMVISMNPVTNQSNYRVLPEPRCEEVFATGKKTWVIARHADQRIYFYDFKDHRFASGAYSVPGFYSDVVESPVDDGVLFAISSVNPGITRIDLAKQNVEIFDQAAVADPGDQFTTIACAEDGKMVVVGSRNGKVYAYDTASKKRLTEQPLSIAKRSIHALEISRDKQLIIAVHGGAATAIHVPTWTTGMMTAMKDDVQITSMCMNQPNENIPPRIAFGRSNGLVDIWFSNPPETGFPEDPKNAGKQSSTVFMMTANPNQVPVRSIHFEKGGKSLLTSAAGQQRVTRFLTTGWDKPKLISETAPPVSTTQSQSSSN